MKLLLLGFLASAIWLAACKREIVPEPYLPSSAHDAYRYSLEQANLHTTALGRDWGPEKKSRFPREMGMVGPHLCQLGGAGPRGADSPGIVSAFRCCFLTSFLTSA